MGLLLQPRKNNTSISFIDKKNNNDLIPLSFAELSSSSTSFINVYLTETRRSLKYFLFYKTLPPILILEQLNGFFQQFYPKDTLVESKTPHFQKIMKSHCTSLLVPLGQFLSKTLKEITIQFKYGWSYRRGVGITEWNMVAHPCRIRVALRPYLDSYIPIPALPPDVAF